MLATTLVVLSFAVAWLLRPRRMRVRSQRRPDRPRPLRPRGRQYPIAPTRIVPTRAMPTRALRPWEMQRTRPPPSPPPPPPPPTVSELASSDPAENTLLAELRRDPASEAARLVYADLLEHRGDVARAQFVRGDLNAHPHEVIETSDFAWRALTSRDRFACRRAGCPRAWDLLVPCVDDERRRDCPACGKSVRYCATIAEGRACVERGEHCVIDVAGALR
jgi:uncharacterized protein (TIGR02996 family)